MYECVVFKTIYLDCASWPSALGSHVTPGTMGCPYLMKLDQATSRVWDMAGMVTNRFESELASFKENLSQVSSVPLFMKPRRPSPKKGFLS